MNNEMNQTATALNGSRHSAGAGMSSPAFRPVAEYAPHPCEPTFEVPALQQPPDTNSHPNERLHLSLVEHSTCRDAALREGGSSIHHPLSSIQPPSSVGPRSPHSRIRNGKIARLPKLERDMVNRMLHNHVPHAKIVGALDEFGIHVTQRNVSNWKTRGGYQEWCVEQERQINLSRLQDNLVDYLRKNDAAQLPEVGLQVAATQLSHMLLQPDMVQQLAAEPEKYSKVVDMLCRLSTHIQTLQKDRNEAVKKASFRGTSEHLKREDEKTVEGVRRAFTSKAGTGPRDPDIPHRNELPKRDELPFREPPPKAPDMLELLAQMHGVGRNCPALPSPQPKPAENPTTENGASA